MTIVSVHSDADGHPRFAIEPGSAASSELEGRRVAPLIVPAPRSWRRIELTGRLHACRAGAESGSDAVFGLATAQCQLGGPGPHGPSISADELRAAGPAPSGGLLRRSSRICARRTPGTSCHACTPRVITTPRRSRCTTSTATACR